MVVDDPGSALDIEVACNHVEVGVLADHNNHLVVGHIYLDHQEEIVDDSFANHARLESEKSSAK